MKSAEGQEWAQDGFRCDAVEEPSIVVLMMVIEDHRPEACSRVGSLHSLFFKYPHPNAVRCDDPQFNDDTEPPKE